MSDQTHAALDVIRACDQLQGTITLACWDSQEPREVTEAMRRLRHAVDVLAGWEKEAA